MLKPQLFTQPKRYLSPMLILSSVLFVQLTFIIIMIFSVDRSEEKVRLNLQRQVRLERLQGDILHLDEVLTMSARMTAASGDLQWEERYRKYEPKLDRAIVEALDLLPSHSLEGMEETNIANAKLVEMELAAFEAVRDGDQQKAKQLLFSPVYEEAKTNYAIGLRQRLQLLDQLIVEVTHTQQRQVERLKVVGLSGVGLLIILWLIIIKHINGWEQTLKHTQKDLQQSKNQLKNKVREMARDLTRVEYRERERIAKLLHDELQQILVAARLHTQLLPESSSRYRTEELLDEALQASRTLTLTLNPPILFEKGLSGSLQWLSKWMFNNYNLTVDLSLNTMEYSINREVQLVIFDSIREFLFNVVKHADITEACVYSCVKDQQLILTVEDKGTGFDLERTLSGQQFGLLYTIQRIKLIGGDISIETDMGAGTRITVTFPLEEESSTFAIDPIRIVLVDDHAIVRQGIRLFLDSQDDMVVVGEASNLSETIDIIAKYDPQIIIMDISLGKDAPNGFEVTQRIRQEGFTNVVIGLSSYDTPRHTEQMERLGIVDFLIKGDDTDKIIDSIRQSVQNNVAI